MGSSASTAKRDSRALKAALVSSALPSTATAEARQVKRFTGIHVGGGIELTASVSADGSSSLALTADPEVLTTLRSRVDRWGTLFLSRRRGAGDSLVVAEALVPGPLTYASAAGRGSLAATAVAGSIAAVNGGQVAAQTVESSKPLSIVASNGGSIAIESGKAPLVHINCSAKSEVQLGQLEADRGVVTAVSSKIDGMIVGSVQITATSSSVTVTAAQHDIRACLNSEVRTGGDGDTTAHSNCVGSVSRTMQVRSKSAREVYP